MHPNFIVFEGGEGSGKTDKSKFVAEVLRAEGRDVLWTREPGGSPYGEKIRALILDAEHGKEADAETMFGLFWANRRDHLQKLIIPVLKRGGIVIDDRFDGSTYAYQIGGQQQSQLKRLFWAMREHYVGKYTPVSYIFCDVDIRTGLARAKGRQEATTHFDDRDVDFHQRVRDGYMEFFASPYIPHAFVDTNGDLNAARQKTLTLVRSLLKI